MTGFCLSIKVGFMQESSFFWVCAFMVPQEDRLAIERERKKRGALIHEVSYRGNPKNI